MELCQKCKSLLMPVKTDGKIILQCRVCNNQTKANGNNMKITEKIEHESKDNIPVFDESNITLPKMKMLCPKCDNSEVYWWTRQTRSTDEPETRFYRCTTCKYTWREYS
ncbi:MAG: transcription factor S [DPANN group archaeon]|nr:transcription factor S [DPANN group archaeon]